MCLSYVCLLLVSLLAICHGQCTFSDISLRVSFGYISNRDNFYTTTINLGYGYLEYACDPGFTLNPSIGSRLTCNSNGSWTPSPKCVLISGGVPEVTNIPTMSLDNGVPCPVDSTTFSIENGSTIDLRAPPLPLETTYSGWVAFSCSSGYTLDPAIGALYRCINGVWSTKPQCLKTGHCSLSTLSTLLSTTTGLQRTGQTQLMQMFNEPNLILNGSYAVFSCMDGYINTAGSLNVTCNANSSWSPFPYCVPSTGSASMTTTIIPGAGTRCPVTSTTFTPAYGYPAIYAKLVLYQDNTATGWVMFECINKYTVDSVTNGIMACNNGVWSTTPRCIFVPHLCFYPGLLHSIASARGLQSIGPPRLLLTHDDTTSWAVPGSFALFACLSGYTNIGGSLNVTCNENGLWSPLPNCVSGAQMTTIPPTDGSACSYTSSIWTIPNGYASSSNGLMLSTANHVKSGSFVDYLCIPRYIFSGNSRMTCTNGTWSPQPMCMAPSQISTTTTLSPLQCVGTPSVPNAYISNTTLISFGNNNYQGQVHFTCNSGYRHVHTSGTRWVTCTNSVWSTLPICAVSPVCSVPELQSVLVNVEIVSSSLSISPSGGILADGWIQLQCARGVNRNPSSTSLNVTCQATGKWTQFPICS